MRIAVITQGDPNNRAGFFNNVHQRVLHLKKEKEVDVDVYLLHYAKKRDRNPIKETAIDGVLYHVYFIQITPWRYFASFKLKWMPFPGYYAVKKYVDLFVNYDLLSVHSIGAMQIAKIVKEKYGIPYVITWHGSDIHTNPQRNSRLRLLTKEVMAYADMNFYVSKALLRQSDSICQSTNKEVLYSGVSDAFTTYDENTKLFLKKKFGVETKRVVAFLGNLISIKNVLSLPLIFKQISISSIGDGVQFWIIGDGNLYEKLDSELKNAHIDYRMFGMQPVNIIPELMNCIDVLVLPSFNEGLPRVTIEAIQCGVSVVGSDVGGISEVVGKDNVFILDNSFVDNVSKRISSIIETGEKPKALSDIFNWDKCTTRELECYRKIINKN